MSDNGTLKETSLFKRRPEEKQIILISTPGHITCAFLRKSGRKLIMEYFDPEGTRLNSKFKKSLKRLPMWKSSDEVEVKSVSPIGTVYQIHANNEIQ